MTGPHVVYTMGLDPNDNSPITLEVIGPFASYDNAAAWVKVHQPSDPGVWMGIRPVIRRSIYVAREKARMAARSAASARR